MKKLNNKLLVIMLVVLAAIFGLSRAFRAGSRDSNTRKELVTLDTAAVTEIRIYPNVENNQELRLVRDGKNWTVKKDTHSANVEQGSAAGAMNYFVHMKPLRLIAKRKTKWKEFNVADTSTRVKFMKGSDVLADVRIGRIGFNQQPGQEQSYRGGVFTHVRLSDEDEVFAVEGFLEGTFNKTYNDWRDKAFLRVKQNSVIRVSFSYPADSSFVLEKRDKKWWVNNLEADSVKVKAYLSHLEYKNGTTFADDFTASGNAQAEIQAIDQAGTVATVKGWKRANDWAISTSHQSGILFSSKGLEGVLERKQNFLVAKMR